MASVVHVAYSKWGGGRHWQFDAVLLGADEHGGWLAVPSGTLMSRPGLEVVTDYDAVLLVPEAPYLALFMDRRGTPERPNPSTLYIDVSTVPVWTGDTVTAVDLDLDVLRLVDGTVVLDDEDEFELHRVELGYPDDVVATAQATAAQLVADVTRRAEPFGAASQSWLPRVAG